MAKHETPGVTMRSRAPESSRPAADASILNTAALAGLTAVLVATPLVPSESTTELGAGANWILVSLIVCAAWLITVVVRQHSVIRWGASDILAVLLIVLISISAVVMARQGCARATINMAWQWVAFGVLFLLSRQLLRQPAAVRAASAVMLGLAVCLTTLAYYQYLCSFPEMRAEFVRNSEAMLREAGIDPTLGSPERKLFEDRLNSTEPLATFALANSLAGFLAPWFVLALGIAATAWRDRRRKESPQGPSARGLHGSAAVPSAMQPGGAAFAWQGAVAAGLAVALIGICLLLTKSRTALLAVGMGVCLLGASGSSVRRLFSWRILLAAAVIIGLLAVVAAGTWDRMVLTETPKSLLYRFQYWEATAELIADHPWFGCGPGNFQHYYTTYKLPQASESIADPHNLFFEVAATAGLPALLVFIFLLAVVAWQCRRAPRAQGPLWLAGADRGSSGATRAAVSQGVDAADPHSAPAGHGGTATPAASKGIYLGALIGIALGWWTGFVFGMPLERVFFLLCVPVAVAFVAALHPWIERGRMPPAAPCLALLVLTVNLLAAGGISFAGIAPSWWFLLAIVSNWAEAVPLKSGVPRVVMGVLSAAALMLVGGCFFTMYSPVLRCRAGVEQGLAMIRLQRPAEAESAFRQAAAADPYSADPWENLAALYHHEAWSSPSGEFLSRFESAIDEVLQRNPHAHTLRRQVGDWRLALFARWGDRRQLEEAVGAYSESVRLYPHHAAGHAQLAWAHHLAGDHQSVVREATEALRLDALNPHREKKLAQQRLYDPTDDSSGQRENAEQTMLRLRN